MVSKHPSIRLPTIIIASSTLCPTRTAHSTSIFKLPSKSYFPLIVLSFHLPKQQPQYPHLQHPSIFSPLPRSVCTARACSSNTVETPHFLPQKLSRSGLYTSEAVQCVARSSPDRSSPQTSPDPPAKSIPLIFESTHRKPPRVFGSTPHQTRSLAPSPTRSALPDDLSNAGQYLQA